MVHPASSRLNAIEIRGGDRNLAAVASIMAVAAAPLAGDASTAACAGWPSSTAMLRTLWGKRPGKSQSVPARGGMDMNVWLVRAPPSIRRLEPARKRR